MMKIYCLTHIETGRKYVGQTIQLMSKRLIRHRAEKKTHIGLAISKYGLEAFSIEILDTANSREELNVKEISWIERLGTLTPNGFNLTAGGKGSRQYPACKGKKRANPRCGWHHTDEAKKKMSTARKGHSQYLVERNKSTVMREIARRSPSEETKRKMGIAGLARWAKWHDEGTFPKPTPEAKAARLAGLRAYYERIRAARLSGE